MGSYIEEVECLFLSAIRKGLCLRASDLEIVRDWESRGVPLDVVSRGIVGGIRKFLAEAEPAAALPSALRYYRTAVEREFDTWSRAAARGMGATDRVPTTAASTGPGAAVPGKPASVSERAGEVLRSRLAGADPAHRDLYARALARFETGMAETPLADLLFQVEDMLVTGLGQSLDPAVFAELKAGVDERVRAAGARGVGQRALEEMRRGGLRSAVATHVGFASVIDEILKEHRR